MHPEMSENGRNLESTVPLGVIRFAELGTSIERLGGNDCKNFIDSN